MPTERLLFESFVFAIGGLGLEVVETALLDLRADERLHLMGHSSVWYLPFYAVCPLAYLHYLHPWLFPLPFYVRAPVYALSFWSVEYAAMGLLRLLLGSSPSEASYRRSPWNVHGLIRLDLGPVWIAFGFAFEWMFRQLRGIG